MAENRRHKKVVFLQPQVSRQPDGICASLKRQLQQKGIPVVTLPVSGPPAIPHFSFKRGLLRRLWLEFRAFRAVWRYHKQEAVVYAPGLQSPGAAIAACLGGKRTLIHLYAPPGCKFISRKLLSCLSRCSGTHTLFASRHLKEQYGLGAQTGKVVYFGLPAPFLNKVLQEGDPKRAYPFTLLLRSSATSGEHIERYIDLARGLPDMQFMLRIEAEFERVRSQFSERTDLPENLIIYPDEKSSHWHLRQAHLLLDLQTADGQAGADLMPVLEAMAYGLPVVSDRNNCEVLQHEQNGLLLPHRRQEQLINGIKQLSTSRSLYSKLAKGARQTAGKITEKRTVDSILSALGFKEAENQPAAP